MYNILGIALKILLPTIYILLEECFQIAMNNEKLKLALKSACDRQSVHTGAMTCGPPSSSRKIFRWPRAYHDYPSCKPPMHE